MPLSFLDKPSTMTFYDCVILSAFNHFPPRLTPESLLELQYFWQYFYQIAATPFLDSQGKQPRPPHIKLVLYAQQKKANDFVALLLEPKNNQAGNIQAAIELIIHWGVFDFLAAVIKALKRHDVDVSLTEKAGNLLMEKANKEFQYQTPVNDIVKHMEDITFVYIQLEEWATFEALWQSWNLGKKPDAIEDYQQALFVYINYLLRNRVDNAVALINSVNKLPKTLLTGDALSRQIQAHLDQRAEDGEWDRCRLLVARLKADCSLEKLRLNKQTTKTVKASSACNGVIHSRPAGSVDKFGDLLDKLEVSTEEVAILRSLPSEFSQLFSLLINCLSDRSAIRVDGYSVVKQIAIKIPVQKSMNHQSAKGDQFEVLMYGSNIRLLYSLLALPGSPSFVSFSEAIQNVLSPDLMASFFRLIKKFTTEQEVVALQETLTRLFVENIIIDVANQLPVNLRIAEESIDTVASWDQLEAHGKHLAQYFNENEDDGGFYQLIATLQQFSITMPALPLFIRSLTNYYERYSVAPESSDISLLELPEKQMQTYPFYALLNEVQKRLSDTLCEEELMFIMEHNQFFDDFLTIVGDVFSEPVMYRFYYDHENNVMHDRYFLPAIGYGNLLSGKRGAIPHPKPALLLLFFVFTKNHEGLIRLISGNVSFFYLLLNSYHSLLPTINADDFRIQYFMALMSKNSELEMLALLDNNEFKRHFYGIFSHEEKDRAALKLSALLAQKEWLSVYLKLVKEYQYPLYIDDEHINILGKLVLLSDARHYLWSVDYMPASFYFYYRGELLSKIQEDFWDDKSSIFSDNPPLLGNCCVLYEFSLNSIYTNQMRLLLSIPPWKMTLDFLRDNSKIDVASFLKQPITFDLKSLQRLYVKYVLPDNFDHSRPFSTAIADAMTMAYIRIRAELAQRFEPVADYNCLFDQGNMAILHDLFVWQKNSTSPLSVFNQDHIDLFNHFFDLYNHSIPPGESRDNFKQVMSQLRRHLLNRLVVSLYYPVRYPNGGGQVSVTLPKKGIQANFQHYIRDHISHKASRENAKKLFGVLAMMPFFVTPSTSTIDGLSTTARILHSCNKWLGSSKPATCDDSSSESSGTFDERPSFCGSTDDIVIPNEMDDYMTRRGMLSQFFQKKLSATHNTTQEPSVSL